MDDFCLKGRMYLQEDLPINLNEFGIANVTDCKMGGFHVRTFQKTALQLSMPHHHTVSQITAHIDVFKEALTLYYWTEVFPAVPMALRF